VRADLAAMATRHWSLEQDHCARRFPQHVALDRRLPFPLCPPGRQRGEYLGSTRVETVWLLLALQAEVFLCPEGALLASPPRVRPSPVSSLVKGSILGRGSLSRPFRQIE